MDFKMFSNHGEQFECIFSHLNGVNFKQFPTMMSNLNAFLAICGK